jgi:peptidoglycan-N-acetylglucosamine deacetylase
MYYMVKSPWWLKRLYPSLVWDMPGEEKVIYLSFDDGPHPEATAFALEQLARFNAKATFFCIGQNVLDYENLYWKIQNEGHAIGNHSFSHPNGWKTKDKIFIADVLKASQHINSRLFRPPYGKITRFQIKTLTQPIAAAMPADDAEPDTPQVEIPRFNIIMWDVVSGDFDTNITPKKCLRNVIEYTRKGSIVVFHDSEKAFHRMQYALPRTLQYFSEKGYRFESIVLK